jgi:hypothetical protein
MGMAVRTSMVGRARAAMAADAVDDDARQDEGHACDADEVRDVLRREPPVNVVLDRAEVDHDVEHAPDGHRGEADEHHHRKACERPEPLYRKH